MRTLLALLCLCAACAGTLCAQEPDAIGAGLLAGKPTGVTAKLWYGNMAVDTGVDLGHQLTLYGDYLWNSWSVLPQPAKGRLPVYLGLGMQVSPEEFGLRIVAGVAYMLPRDRFELFFDVVPVVRLSPGSSGGVNASAGVRYYFKGI